MGVKIIIKNFEIIEDAKINVEGITSLVGETNNGKTAVYNALKTMVFNVMGTSYIRKVNGKPVKDGCKIGVLFEEDQLKVFFEKSDSPSYKLNDIKNDNTITLEKVGRGDPPDDVSALINMHYIDVEGNKFYLNFIEQQDAPLLKGMSEFQLYKTAVKSFDGEKIQEAIKLVRADLDVVIADLKGKELEIEIQKKNRLRIIENLKKYKELDLIKGDFEIYDKSVRMLPVVKEYWSRYENTTKSLKHVENSLKKLSSVDKISSTLDKVRFNIMERSRLLSFVERENEIMEKQNKIGELLSGFSFMNENWFKDGLNQLESTSNAIDKLVGWNNDKLTLEDDLNSCNKKLSYLGNVQTVVSGLAKAIEANQNVRWLGNQLGAITNANERLTLVNEQLKTVGDELNDAQYKLDNNICTKCNQKMENEDMEIKKELIEKIDTLKEKKSGLVGQQNLINNQLTALKKEVKDAGYDPDKLPDTIKTMEESVTKFEEKATPIVDKMLKEVQTLEDEEHSADDVNLETDDFNM